MAAAAGQRATTTTDGEGAMAACSSVPPSSPGERLDAEELRRLQLAHEGMRLLLSSEVKRAEQLFRKSR